MLINVSDKSIVVYTPGFVGPILANKKIGEEFPPELQNRFGERDFILLRPHEFLGRAMDVEMDLTDFEVHARYHFYEPGHEGDQRYCAQTLFHDGTLFRRPK